jgi:cardiolipin synthase A/B
MRKVGRRIVVGVVVVAVVLGVALAIAQDQQTLQIRSAVAADDPRALGYIAALVDAGLSGGNTFDVLKNGDEIFPAMLGAIDEARERVSFETYIYQKGAVAEQFTARLEAAARRGVQVNLVVDSFGSSAMPDEHVQRLRNAGCHIAEFNGPRWYQLEELNYRTHRKILVVDGQVGFVGGVGVADHWSGHAQDKNHWRDSQIRMRGPIVRRLEAAFYENFIEGGGIVTPSLDPGAPGGDGAGADALIVRGAPTGGSNDLKRLYLLTLALARRTVDITTPYFVTDESTMWAIRDAAARGVRIRVLMEGDITDARSVKYASRQAYEELLSLGAELYEYQPTMMHTKALVVDGAWSVFGSANFDNRSLELNDEINVAMRDRDLAETLARTFEDDVRSAKRLTLEDWKRRGLLEKAREQFWRWFAEIF